MLQADLMEKIGEVLTNYMALKEEQVNEAMGGFSSKMQTASQNLGASSKLLHDYATASQQRLKVRLAFLAPQQASTLWTLCLLHPRHLKRCLSNIPDGRIFKEESSILEDVIFKYAPSHTYSLTHRAGH